MDHSKIALLDPSVKTFVERNPAIDISSFNFMKSSSVQSAGISTEGTEQLEKVKSLQRILRVCGDWQDAGILLNNGFDSAQRITSLAESQFVGDMESKLPGGRARAKKIYINAGLIKSRIQHAWAHVNHLRKSPYLQQVPSLGMMADIDLGLKDIPSYQDLFGSLNFCDCPDCMSILGPAAYLTDLLRLIDKAITAPNKLDTSARSFNSRRPDIGKRKLTCANTNNLIPYLQIVNEILQTNLENQLQEQDIMKRLDQTYYPLNLPFNLPLSQIRLYFEQNQVALADVYSVYKKSDDWSLAIAAERLHLSPTEWENLKEQDAAKLPEVLTRNFDLPISEGDLAGLQKVEKFTAHTDILLTDLEDLLTQGLGPEEIYSVSGKYKNTVTGDLFTFVQRGNNITATGIYEGATIAITAVVHKRIAEGSWKTDSKSGYCLFEFNANATAFTSYWNDRMGEPWKPETIIGERESSSVSTVGLIPHQFFINYKLAPAKYLHIESGDGNLGDFTGDISELNMSALDCVNRFMRLSQKLGWDYATFDWLLLTLQKVRKDITEPTLADLALVKQLETEFKVPLDLLVILWFDIKTTGVGTGQYSSAPFDVIFNGPGSRKLEAGGPYHPVYTGGDFINPLYQSEVIDWNLQARNQGTDKGYVIVSSIPVSVSSLRLMADKVLGITDKVPLTVKNLSALYRHCVFAKWLAILPQEYVALMQMLNIIDPNSKRVAEVLSPAQVKAMLEAVAWIREAKVNGMLLQYCCKGEPSPFVSPGYEEGRIGELLQAINKAVTPLLVSAGSLRGEGVSDALSDELYTWLIVQEYVLQSGLVSNKKTLTSEKITLVLSEQQKTNIVNVLTDSRTRQGSAFSESLAAFLSSELTTTAAVARQAGEIYSDADFLNRFLLPLLFETPSDEVMTKPPSTLDKAKVIAAFRQHNMELAGEVTILDEAAGSWTIREQISVEPNLYVEYYAYQPAGKPSVYFYHRPFFHQGQFFPFVLQFTDACARLLLMYNSLATEVATINKITSDRNAFHLTYELDNGRLKFPLENVDWLFTFLQFKKKFQDNTNQMEELFGMHGATPDQVVEKLAGITGWEKSQLTFAVADLSLGDCNNIDSFSRLVNVFSCVQSFQSDVQFGADLSRLALAYSKTPDTTIDPSVLAETILQNLKPSMSESSWATTWAAIDGKTNEIKRDAMLPLAVYETGKAVTNIKSAEGLYEWLLIDVKKSGVQTVSYVKEALNAAQLYIQRCIMSLEEGVVVKKSDLPESNWDWMMSFQTWVANRQVFLYPENFVDPGIRKSKTDLFVTLENELSQSNITDETVEAAFTKYMDEFQSIANLKYVDAYQCNKENESGNVEEVLFLFARTRTVPYQYYYITRTNQKLWSQWNEINIPINAENITGLYAFSKLYIFWTEIKDCQESTTTNDKINISKLSISCSYYDFSGNWKQPQVILADQTICVGLEQPQAEGFVNPFGNGLFFADQPYFHRLMALPVSRSNILDNEWKTGMQEKLVIFFGPFVDISKVSAGKSPGYDKGVPPVVANYEKNIWEQYNEIVAMSSTSEQYWPLCAPVVVNSDLSHDYILNPEENFLFVDDRGTGQALSFCPSETQYTISHVTTGILKKLEYRSVKNTLYTSYIMGEGAGPSPVGEATLMLADVSLFQSGILPVHNQPGMFLFENNDEVFLFQKNVYKNINELLEVTVLSSNAEKKVTSFCYNPKNIIILEENFVTERISTGALPDLSKRLFIGGLDRLLDLSAQQVPVETDSLFENLKPAAVVMPPALRLGNQVDFYGCFGNYYWELFFFAPMLVAQRLAGNQRFREGEDWLQYVFDPTLHIDLVTSESFRSASMGPGRATLYFDLCVQKNLISKEGLVTEEGGKVTPQELLTLLENEKDAVTIQIATHVWAVLQNFYLPKSGTTHYWRFQPFRAGQIQPLWKMLTDSEEIRVYDNDPFDPHAIARLRPGAYPKAVVMKYIENLTSWGDQDFRRYTWETINSAMMLYEYARNLLGPRPLNIGDCQTQFPVSFQEIKQAYANTTDGIPQFLIDMENAISVSIPVNLYPTNPPNGMPFNDIDAYFCVPENDKFISCWDIVEGRLFNIRHSLNIDGVAQPLPLFEPAIDPMAFVKAAAAGSNLMDVVTLMQPDIPSHRFRYMLDQAKNITSTLMQLGGNILSALEKGDSESFALMQSVNEINILQLTTLSKQQAIEDLQEQLNGLQQNLASANYRKQFYSDLITAGLNAFEIMDLALRNGALIPSAVAMGLHGGSIAAYLVPDIFGLANGGMDYGQAVSAGAQICSVSTEILNQVAGLVSTAGSYERRMEDWRLQRDLADYDASQMVAQVKSTQVRIAIAQQDLMIHKKSIEQSVMVNQFLKSKFTSKDLYQWMTSRLSTLYFQTYNLALTAALKAQAAYQFEMDNSDLVINFNYWDNLYKGLLAGESLMLSLQQLEVSHAQKNRRRFEITKTISLKGLSEEKFNEFRGNGELEFELSEELFTGNYPDNYCLKIHSVTISIPAIIGPYNNIYAILTQNTNKIIMDKDGKNIRENWIPSQAIALSSGVNDSGLFQLDFNDERYLPFEGTGAISTWRLSMNKTINKDIDFEKIPDVIVNLQYTARR